MIKLGIVTGVIGVNGAFFVRSEIDFGKNSLEILKVKIGFSEKFSEEFFVEKFTNNENGYTIKVKDIDSKEEAQRFKEKAVFINSELIEKDYLSNPFILKGFEAVNLINNTQIGIVEDIIQSASNNLLVIKSTKGEILIPFVDEIVQEVKFKKKRILINVVPGLIDLNI